MRYPSAAAYMDALQDPASCFTDPELAEGTPALTPLGLPRAMSGNIATVFRVDCPTGRSYAVRCFVRPFEDEERRYAAIEARLGELRPTWGVGFDFQPFGMVVSGAKWPILKMDWSSGESLTSYVERNLWDSSALAYLAVRFAALAGDLQEAGVAHGDLQHGNILVAPGGDLRLIDYDGMYVPDLEGLTSNERGHRNYQHPGRTHRDFGPHLDRFPSWVIYTSLVAVAADPLLWGRLDGGDECLLFRQDDLERPETSPVFSTLQASGELSVTALARMLRSFLRRDIAAVPPLALLHAPKPPQARRNATSLDPRELAEKQSLYAALRGTGDAGRVTVVASVPGRTTRERPPPAAATPFSATLRLPRVAARASLGLVLAVLVLAVTGAVPPAIVVVTLLLAGGAALALGNRTYRTLPEVAAAREAEEELGRRHAEAADAQAAVDELTGRRAALDEQEVAARQRTARLADELRQQEAIEVRAVEDRLRESLASLSTREQALHKAEREALDEALSAAQQERVDAELAHHRVATALQRGVSDTVVYGLALDGIRTAADLVDVRCHAGGTVVVTRDGREVRATAIGPREAKAILAWRRSLTESAAMLAPRKLSPVAERQVRQRFASLRAELAAEEAPARAAAAEAAARVAVRFQPRHAELQAELKTVEAGIVRRRVELDRQLALARKEAAEARWRAESFEEEAAAFRDLTLIRFLRQLAWH